MLPYMAEYACYRPPITGGRGPVGCLSARRPLQITLSVRSSNHLAFYALSCNILAKLAYMRFLTQYLFFSFIGAQWIILANGDFKNNLATNNW